MFEHIAEEKGCVGAIIELGEATDSFVTLFETIARSIANDSKSKKGMSAKAKDLLEGMSLAVSYGPIGVGFAKTKDAPPDTIKFKSDMTKIYNEIGCPFIIMLDNAEQLLNIKGALFELRNIFQMIQSMDGVRCMLILSGRETLFSDIRSASEPAARFFWGIELQPFTGSETRDAIEKPLRGTGVKFAEECIAKIQKLTQGHPYFVQVFAYNLYSLRKTDTVTVEDMNLNFGRILSFLGRRIFDSLFANITSVEKEIVLGFGKIDADVATNAEISNASKVKGVNQYLTRLSEMNFPMICKVERGKYKLFHPLFKEYLRMKKVGE